VWLQEAFVSASHELKIRDLVIIGGGLAGLTVARHCQQAGMDWVLLEAQSKLGGRVQTDLVDGFQLDRGFQVYLTAYPDAAKELDLTALNLKPFQNGALIYTNQGVQTIADPWRSPNKAFASAMASVGSLIDKLKVAQLRDKLLKTPLSEIHNRPEQTTEAYLKQVGFSNGFIERFFKPFFGGIFLESELDTSSRMFEFVFKMMAEGETALPEGGMGSIPNQLAQSLPDERIHCDVFVQGFRYQDEQYLIHLHTGEQLMAKQLVIATDPITASRWIPELPPVPMTHTTCLYFSVPSPPYTEPYLMLNGTGKGPVNHLCVPTQVNASYGPSGQSLISLSCVGMFQDEKVLIKAVLDQMHQWFGSQVNQWRYLKSGVVFNALPQAYPGANFCRPQGPVPHPKYEGKGLYVAGDYRNTASINGAIASGQAIAASVMDHARSQSTVLH
jgi:phytoene dehydrogenase-like protein